MKWIQGLLVAVFVSLCSGCVVTTTTTTTVPSADYVYYTGSYGYRPYTTSFGFSYGPSFGYTTRSWYGYSFSY